MLVGFRHMCIDPSSSSLISLFTQIMKPQNKNKEHPLLTLCRRRRNIRRRCTNKHRRRAIARIKGDAVCRRTNEHRRRVIARIEDATVRRFVSSPPPIHLRCQAPLSSAAIAPLAVAVVPGPPMILLLRRGQICLASHAVMPPPRSAIKTRILVLRGRKE
ncbi:hypothetical protein LINPERHAP2_LOCUS38595 [Linum perenne]